MDQPDTDQDNAKKNSRWKRSAQVCTSCRKSKLRCDFLERFPQPCTRCSNAADSRPCIVTDPPTKRVNNKATRKGLSSFASPSNDGSTSTEPSPPSAHDSQASEVLQKPIGQQTLGSITLSEAEIQTIFDEFFTHYHPFLNIYSAPIDPSTCLSRSKILFWTICCVGCRPRPDHPILRARNNDLCQTLNSAFRPLIGELFISTSHSVGEVQALLILCEWPFRSTQRGGLLLSWKYSGLANQLGLHLGLHRPHHMLEFDSPINPLDAHDVVERSETWVKCYIVHAGVATNLGLPFHMTDDYVISTVAQARDDDTDWLKSLHKDTAKLLRIHRFCGRMSSTLGNSVQVASGRHDAGITTTLTTLLNTELEDLERGLIPMSPIVSVNFLNAKLALHMYSLQQDISKMSAQEFVSCYSTSMRIMGILQGLTLSRTTAASFWSRSIWYTFIVSTLALIKLATIQTLYPDAVPIDRSIVFNDVRRAYIILSGASMFPGDKADRIARVVKFLGHRLSTATPADPAAPMFSVRGRMSLGNLVYDALLQLPRYKDMNPCHGPAPHNQAAGTSAEEALPAEVQAAQGPGQSELGHPAAVLGTPTNPGVPTPEMLQSLEPGALQLPSAFVGPSSLALPGPLDFAFAPPPDMQPQIEICDADELRRTFEDMLSAAEPMEARNGGTLSAQNWAEMVGDMTFSQLDMLWNQDMQMQVDDTSMGYGWDNSSHDGTWVVDDI